MEYSELTMHPDLARSIVDAGYVTCMPVQAAVFPHAFAGEDIYAQSQTGTGKTAAFLVSIFQRIMEDPQSRHRKVLILAPTRELAVQIEAEARKLAKHLPISMGCFYGGVAYGPQFDMLRDKVQMIIGTPGRIIDLVEQGKMLLRDVGFLVVDEADRMFDMGFIDDLRKLLRYLPPPKERQTYLFSATLNFRIKNLAWEYMDEPKEILIEAETVTVDLVSQELYHVGSDEKFRVLLGLLERDKPKSALIFCNQKFMAEEISRRLGINGYECEYIMGDLPQAKRLQVIERLKAGNLAILVATDVAARGLDVNALDVVVNYDVPMEPESYVHRIGRTARAGAAGKAITLACEKFVYGLPAIEKYIETKIPVFPVTPELFGDDKSSGVRFGHSRDRARTSGDRVGNRGGTHGTGSRGPGYASSGGDRHGRPAHDRGDRRPNHADRGAPRPSAPPRDGAPRPDAARTSQPRPQTREGGRPNGDRPQQNRGPVQQGARAYSPQQPDRQRAPAPRTGSQQSRDPYAISSEERMSRYKEKYAGPSSGQPATEDKRPRAAPKDTSPRQGSPAGSSGSRTQSTRQPGILERIKRLFGLGKDTE
jgi:ATP-dependent RNA helicase RhlB